MIKEGSKIEVEDIYPLSPLQQGLIFHTLRSPASGVYFVQSHCTLLGDLEMESFAAAWRHCISRHPILRTAFRMDLDPPLQIVYARLHEPLETEDWRRVPATEQQPRLTQWLRNDIERGFELTRPPLWRVGLLRTGDHTHVLVFSVHHALLDGWSAARLLPEVLTAYDALTLRKPVMLAPAPPYRDYIAWLQRQDAAGAEEFWRRQLAGARQCALLRVGGVAEGGETHHQCYMIQKATLSSALSTALRRFARTHEVTLNVVAQGAWAVLLSRHTGSADVCFGVTVASRPADLPGAQSIQGLLMNTLPLRLRVEPGECCADWLQSVQRQAVALRQFDHVALHQLMKYTEVPPGQALFDTLYVFENYPLEAAVERLHGGASGLRIAGFQQRGQANYPLSMSVVPTEQLEIKAQFDTRYLQASAAVGLLERFERLLEQMVQNPRARLAELTVLTEAQRHQLLVQWNATGCDYPRERCFHELFAEQVARTPQTMALVYEEERLTYRELDARANQLAHHLRAIGVGPDVVVGLCVERSPQMVIGLLGILKAGGAYLPLDPTFPMERLAFMLGDAEALLVLTQERLRGRLPAIPERVCLDTLQRELDQQPVYAPVVTVCPANLAYVIYTSGSTGRPKGVMCSHDGLVNYAAHAARTFEAAEGSGSLVTASIAFDLIVTSLHPPLICGGTVILLAEQRDALEFASVLRESRDLTIVKLTPSYLEALGSVLLDNEIQGRIRTMVIGGEMLQAHVVRRWREHAPATRLFNHYAPTETIVGRVVHEVADVSQEGTIPIGRPIANTQVYVLDRELELVPVEVEGELYISGVGLARGYLARAGLTAQRFVANPYGEPGGRMYRTGDRVRWRSDGELECLGRIDQQVKVRGYRIEPGEIEAALQAHAHVRQAVVVVREDEPGARRLVAYVVMTAGVGVEEGAPKDAAADAAGPVSSRLREHLQRTLPEYMVPAAYVELERLPLTPNGKVDRAALPAPEGRAPGLEYLEARTPTEQALVGIWQEVLHRDEVGIRENFFELGGDSIVAIKVVARASRMGLKLTVRQLFEHPTIGQLALEAVKGHGTQAEQGLVQGAVPLTPIQHWYFEAAALEAHHYNQSVLLQARQRLSGELIRQALGELMKHHDALRLRFWHAQRSWQQQQRGWDEQEVLPFEQVDLSQWDAAGQEWRYARRAQQLQESLDLSVGPLVRVGLFDFGAGQPQRLLWIIHHLATDGVSWRILLEDFQQAYEQLVAGQAVRLAPKSTSFKSFAQRLSAYAGSPDAQLQCDYWRSLQGCAQPPLPVDHPVSPAQEPGWAERVNTVGRMGTASATLDGAQTQALLQEVPAVYHTQINDVLLTALLQCFSEWTGQPQLLVDLEGHGREEVLEGVDLSRTVGWFTSVFPVLLREPDSAQSGHPVEVGARLQSVKEQLRAVPERGIGYGIGRYLVPAALADIPTPQVGFNYLGRFDQDFTRGDFFELGPQHTGAVRGAGHLRHHLIDVVGMIVGGELQLEWQYSGALYEAATIETLSQQYLRCLEDLIAHCQHSDGAYLASDFPLLLIES